MFARALLGMIDLGIRKVEDQTVQNVREAFLRA